MSKVDHKTIRVRGGLVQDSVDWRVRMNRMMNLQAPSRAGNFVTSRLTVPLSKGTRLALVCTKSQ